MIDVGGKAQGLIRLRDELGMPVPEFLVVPFCEAFDDFENLRLSLQASINAYLSDGDETRLADALQSIMASASLDESALAKVHAQVESQTWQKVSFRTSAQNEDGADSSFAGQYESFLDVEYSFEQLHHHALACFESMLTLRVLRYARERSLRTFDIGGSFIVQEMFYGDTSGVLFTENGSGAIAIAIADSWRNTVVEGGDSREVVVPRDGIASALISKELRTLCNLALQAEERVGTLLDIEWSIRENQVMVLQMRPITVANLSYELEWDSTNISENYPGITLPLTYSVIRELYAGVYMSFLRLLGTPERVIKADENAFRNMLGYLNGNVYYRITNWYALLKFLPGRANQEYFEAMLNPVAKRSKNAKQKTRLDVRSAWARLRFVWLLLTSERRSRRFRDDFAKRLRFFKTFKVDYINAARLLEASKQIRAEMLADWATPILNDIKLMVFHGILRRKFFNSDDQSEYLNFLAGLSDRASLKPLEMLSALGKTTADALAREGVSSLEALRATPSWPRVAVAADEYVAAFGSRTPGELKLESVRLTDNIEDVLELALKAADSPASHSDEPAASALKWPAHVPTYQRPLLKWIATNTRRAIDWRERFRFNRAQTFDLSRSMYDAVGKTLAAEGLIETARDIYWLTEQEVDEIVNAHTWSLDAKATVASRKSLLESHTKSGVGLAMRGAGRIAAKHLSPVVSGDEVDGLVGRGVAPGILTAEVVVCTEFDPNVDVRGKILVVHHIDPGWTLLFTQAAGIVAERGNALSHAAIIAREIGIPAVVAAVGATTELATGDVVTINGVLGTITSESN